MTSNSSAVTETRCYVKSEDDRDPAVPKVAVDTVTSSDGVVTSSQFSPSQMSDKWLGAEATDPVSSVTPSRGNVKRDVKLTSGVKVTETPKGGDFHLVFDRLTHISPSYLRRDRCDTERC